MKQYAALDDTVYLWFASNDTSGSGGDGASAAADVRLAGAAAGAAPVYSPTPALLTHANYPAGSYEIAITASAANGFATGNTYAVFCTLAIDSQNPTGFVGSFDLKPVESDVTQWLGTAPNTPTVAGVPEVDITHLLGTAWLAPSVAGTPDVNAKLLGGTAQTGRDIGASVLLSTGTGAGQLDFTSGIVKSNLTQILAHLLTQTGTQLADGFEHFFDVATPTGTVDSLPAAAPNAAGGLPISAAGGLDLDTKLANTNEITAARMGALTDWINGGRLDNLLDAIPTTAMRGTDNATLAATWTDARAGYLDNLSAGAVALASGVDLTSIHGAALTETVNGYLAAAFTKLFDVATPLLVASEVMRGTDGANTTVPDAAGVAPTAAEIKTALEAAGSHLALILADTGTDGVLLAATATSAQLIDDMWDEILTGATHNIVNSAGRRIREIGAYAVESGTAQAGNPHSITLAATASAIDGTYNRNLIILTDNTGVGQTRTIVDYDGTSKIAVIDRDWRTSPDATTTYQITPDNTPLVVDQGVAQSGTATTIKLRAYASSTNNIYLCNVVAIIAGTGRGQARLVGSYDGTSKVATICGDNWVITPDTTSVYVLMPYGTTCTSCIGTYALGLINTECDTALTDYGPPTRTEATADKDAIITEVNANETKIDALQTDSTAIKAKTDNLPSGISKNVALSGFNFYMVLSSDHVTEATGKTIAGTISKDGSAFAGLTNAISEIASGMYKVDLIQAEMNADVVTLKFTEATCDQRIITIYTS